MSYTIIQEKQEGSRVTFSIKIDEFEEERIGAFNFKFNEGMYRDKEVKSFKTFLNKLWREYPLAMTDNRPIEQAKLIGKQEIKHQNKIWEYQDIARKLKSDYDYTDSKLKELFDSAAELENYFKANNLEDNIIMM